MTALKTTFKRGDVVQFNWNISDPSDLGLVIGYDTRFEKLRMVMPGGSDYYRSYCITPDEIRLATDTDYVANPKFNKAFIAEALQNSTHWKWLQQQYPSEKSSFTMVHEERLGAM